ncbi:FtsW/RodA/SpoVE family cell cycle protein [Paenisporosarcina quisquiliarum]|uniref:FtsW/RodA/SpoVE family cell cycle protein n=1 Tax=Paenisporosarcina quisquiliarum TaxID=365346 RepID=UPI003735D460
MIPYFKRYAKNFDYPLFFTYLFLCLFGLVMIYSASMAWSVRRYDFESDHFYKKQILNLIISVPVFLLAAIFPYKHYRKKVIMITMLVVMFVLLALVHLIGYSAGGAQSWINLGFGNLQPSELAKIIIVLYFAGVFANKASKGPIDSFNQSIAPPVTVLVLAVAFVLSEVDMGSAMILFLTAISVMAASGIKIRTFVKMSAVMVGGLAVTMPILYLVRDKFITEKRLGRIEAFLNPFEYEQGFGYQVVNGYYAIGAGGWKGLGLGQSVQKLGYLPEPQTDFIMAIIAEELGIIGVLIVIGGLGFIVLRALTIALRAEDPHARMIAAGFGSIIGIQTFINLGGLLGIIPLTGVPLPFISYGGTSVILLSLAMGILLNVSMFVKYEKTRT